MIQHSIFLFEKQSCERFTWLFKSLMKVGNSQVDIFLTGDALITFQSLNLFKIRNELLQLSNITINIDKIAWDIYGFPTLNIVEGLKRHVQFLDDFWGQIVKIPFNFPKDPDSKVGFFQLKGPYQDRTSVYAVKVFQSTILAQKSPEIYLYLDGIHLGHNFQGPSAFQNIGSDLETSFGIAKQMGFDPQILACSRCATARGYVSSQSDDGSYIGNAVIEPFQIVNLNDIINRFAKNHLIIHPSSITSNSDEILESSYFPQLNIIISHHPYGSEWTFGGLSFAIAAANNGIKTNVIFVEDGVFALMGTHLIGESLKIFNMQDIIESSTDDENLTYYYLKNSWNLRSSSDQTRFPDVKSINDIDISHILYSNSKNENIPRSNIRSIFF